MSILREFIRAVFSSIKKLKLGQWNFSHSPFYLAFSLLVSTFSEPSLWNVHSSLQLLLRTIISALNISERVLTSLFYYSFIISHPASFIPFFSAWLPPLRPPWNLSYSYITNIWHSWPLSPFSSMLLFSGFVDYFPIFFPSSFNSHFISVSFLGSSLLNYAVMLQGFVLMHTAKTEYYSLHESTLSLACLHFAHIHSVHCSHILLFWFLKHTKI